MRQGGLLPARSTPAVPAPVAPAQVDGERHPLHSSHARVAPVHRAARLSFLQGDVIVDHLDNTAGDPAQINMPLAEGSRLTTGENGQAEVEFEDGSVVRLTPNSSLGLTGLSIDPAENFHTQLTVLHGLGRLR